MRLPLLLLTTLLAFSLQAQIQFDIQLPETVEEAQDGRLLVLLSKDDSA